jgi:hypothetical protein
MLKLIVSAAQHLYSASATVLNSVLTFVRCHHGNVTLWPMAAEIALLCLCATR